MTSVTILKLCSLLMIRFYHNEDEENSVEDTEPIAEVPAKDVILLFSDLWSEVYTTKIVRTLP